MWADFHFIRPYWFIALIPLILCLWFLAKQHLVNRHWESVCDPALLPYILVGRSGRRRNIHLIYLLLAILLAVIALAGPSWEKLPQPVFQKESALVIALDLSYSMYADDIKPSRLERARFKISDLLDLRKEGQTALLVYAGGAFTVTPLTDDTKTIKSQLSALTPDIMPAPGSNTAAAIDKATELLKQAGHNHGHILVITDEVDIKFEDDFANANNEGFKISILATGTEEGAPVKLNSGDFLKDRKGSIVIPKLDKDGLRKLVNRGGGLYQNSQINDGDIINLNQFFNQGQESGEKKETEFDTDRWQEFGPWLVLLIIPIMAFSFRKGYLGILVCIIIMQPDDAVAIEWDDLWLNKDQQAMRALQNKQIERASELFDNKDWKATAKYQAGDYAAAEELLSQDNDIRSTYNRGNAMARQGKYEEALAAYDAVLRQSPGHEDAKFNKELIEKELEKQQQQSQQNQQQSGSDQDQQQDSQSKDSEQQAGSSQQDSQQSQQESGESEQEQAQPSEQQQQAESQKSQQQSGQDEAEQQARNQESDEQQHQNKMQEQQQEKTTEDQTRQLAQQSSNELDEEQQATEQWLRRIPDDPSGLLRRKFKYQYQQQKRQTTTGKYW